MRSGAITASVRQQMAGAEARAAALRLTLEKLGQPYSHLSPAPTPSREQRTRLALAAQAEARERSQAAQEWYESAQCRALGAATRERARRFLNAIYPLTGWEEEEAEAREAGCYSSLDPAFSSWHSFWSMVI